MIFRRRKRSLQRLLIVEDEPLIAFEIEYALTSEDYTVVATVDHGEQAMAVMASEPVDALVTDIGLAGELRGTDIARAAFDKGIKVLLVTGNCPEDAGEFAHACLLKPYREADLIDALRTLDRMAAGEAVSSTRRLTIYPTAN